MNLREGDPVFYFRTHGGPERLEAVFLEKRRTKLKIRILRTGEVKLVRPEFVEPQKKGVRT